jgi:two-component system, response regulator YesN
MLRLLIVDDEPMFRESLVQAVDWGKLEIEVVGEAYNGCSALGILEDTAVDVIITDIRMPEMDGLELIRRASVLHPDIRYIVLSAFDDFILVKQAFLLGIVDYLLKSEIREDDLAKILTRQAAEIQRRAVQQIPGAAYAAEAGRQFTRQMLRSCVERRLHLPMASLPEKYAASVFAGGVYSVVLGIHFRDCHISTDQIYARLSESFELLEKIVDQHSGWIGYSEQQRYILFFFSQTKLSWRDFSYETEKLRCEVEHELQQICSSCTVSAGFSSLKQTSVLSRMKGEAERAFQLYFIRGCGKTWGYNRYLESCNNAELPDNRLFRRFIEFIKTRDIPGAVQHLKEFQLSPPGLRGSSVPEVVTLFSKYHYHLLSYCEQMKIDEDPDIRETLDHFLTLLAAAAPLNDLNEWLSDILNLVLAKTQGKNSLVNRVAGYIKNNYHREISLSGVAEHFNVNPSYLSRLFSRYIEKGFNAYLTEVRVVKARHLLETENLRVHEVAQLVGIGNPESFSRIFKRVTGKPPRDYLMGNPALPDKDVQIIR